MGNFLWPLATTNSFSIDNTQRSYHQILLKSLELSNKEIAVLNDTFKKMDPEMTGLANLIKYFPEHIGLESSMFMERLFLMLNDDDKLETSFTLFAIIIWNYCTLIEVADLGCFVFDLYNLGNSEDTKDVIEFTLILEEMYGPTFTSNQHLMKSLADFEALGNENHGEISIEIFSRFCAMNRDFIAPAILLQEKLRALIGGEETFWKPLYKKRQQWVKRSTGSPPFSRGDYIPVRILQDWVKRQEEDVEPGDPSQTPSFAAGNGHRSIDGVADTKLKKSFRALTMGISSSSNNMSDSQRPLPVMEPDEETENRRRSSKRLSHGAKIPSRSNLNTNSHVSTMHQYQTQINHFHNPTIHSSFHGETHIMSDLLEEKDSDDKGSNKNMNSSEFDSSRAAAVEAVLRSSHHTPVLTTTEEASGSLWSEGNISNQLTRNSKRNVDKQHVPRKSDITRRSTLYLQDDSKDTIDKSNDLISSGNTVVNNPNNSTTDDPIDTSIMHVTRRTSMQGTPIRRESRSSRIFVNASGAKFDQSLTTSARVHANIQRESILRSIENAPDEHLLPLSVLDDDNYPLDQYFYRGSPVVVTEKSSKNLSSENSNQSNARRSGSRQLEWRQSSSSSLASAAPTTATIGSGYYHESHSNKKYKFQSGSMDSFY